MAEAFKKEFAPPTTNTENNNTVNISLLFQQLIQGLQDYDRNKTLVKSLKYEVDDMQEHLEDTQSQLGLMKAIISSLVIVLEDKNIVTRNELVEAQTKFYKKLQTPKQIMESQISAFKKDLDFVYGDASDEIMQFIMNNLNKEYDNKDDEDNN